jgi:hypothetical protein
MWSSRRTSIKDEVAIAVAFEVCVSDRLPVVITQIPAVNPSQQSPSVLGCADFMHRRQLTSLDVSHFHVILLLPAWPAVLLHDKIINVDPTYSRIGGSRPVGV